MEYWKLVILTYISVALIEGIPTGNDINDQKTINMVKLAVYDQDDDFMNDAQPRAGPLVNLFNKRTSTTSPIFTTVPPGSLADLNLKMDAMKNQLTSLNLQIVAEEQKVTDLTLKMQDINNQLNILTNLLGP